MSRQPEDRVVVGYDGSEHSGAAVDWAAAEAARRGVALTVVHATEFAGLSPGVGASPGLHDAALRAARVVAEEGAARARKTRGDVVVHAETFVGTPSGTLVEMSRRADLVVVGTRGRGAVAGAVLGSIAFAVSAHAHCPVIVVRRPSGSAGTTRPVVVGVDGSAAADAALAFAADHAAGTGAPLRVLAVWRPPSADLWALSYWNVQPGDHPAAEARRKADDILRSAAEEVAEAAAGTVRRRYRELDVTVDVAAGPPGQVLADAARDADLVVVGARGRGGFTGLLLGSVSHAVIHGAHCPIAVLRAKRGT